DLIDCGYQPHRWKKLEMSELLMRILIFADAYDMLPGAGLVLACVSGGADSMCLLEALLEISHERGFDVGVAHYNHGLRGEESMRDEAFVREYCRALRVPLYCGSGDVKTQARKSRLGIEETARNMRYGFFNDIAEKTGALRIATAHTADDNAETIIMNLARGAGAKGLSGIPPKRGSIIRPMLRVSREDVLRYNAERSIAYVEDSTNSLDVITRNKVRHKIMPLIREINPLFNEAAAATSELSRADEDYLSGLADEFINERCPNHSANAEEIVGLPPAVSRRVIRKLYGGNLSYKHVESVLELCRRAGPSASLSLPGMTVFREYDRIVFIPQIAQGGGTFKPIHIPIQIPIPAQTHTTPCDSGEDGGETTLQAGFAPADGEPCCLKEGDSVVIPGLGLKMSCKSLVYNDTINKSFTSFLFKYADLCGKMTVRPRREGDKIRLFGQNSTKTLKKLFIERRIPVRERALIPVIADDRGVLAVYGIGVGDRAAPAIGGLAFQISFEGI
ncbi:MAG: tRNA lysidine(34) synthetase TilS, partial [Defluviitaleaceae bacterium]|nr:tRNA lysidine(34) synthetase TilS [Defluviitaleaceae bacterium]